MPKSDVLAVRTASGSLYLIDLVAGFLLRQPGLGAATFARDRYLVVVGDFLQVEPGLPMIMRPYPVWNGTFAPLESTPVVSIEPRPDEDPLTWPVYPGDRQKYFGDPELA
jgi:hypothetical protein